MLAIEELLQHRDDHMPRYGEVAHVGDERYACLGHIEVYTDILKSLTPYDIFCLDRLEGVFEEHNCLRERHWCDVFDIQALLQRLPTSLYIYVYVYIYIYIYIRRHG